VKGDGYAYTRATGNYPHVPTAFAICVSSFAANFGIIIPSVNFYIRRFLENPHQKLSIHLLHGKTAWSQYPCWVINVENNSEDEPDYEPLLEYPCLELEPQKAVDTRGTNPTSRQTLELSRHWLSTCKSGHKNCGPYVDENTHFLPTRLLDVGSPGQKSIKLVLSKDISHAGCTDYVTLSYCWGTKRNAACTTQENLIEQMRAIPTESLPRTIKDAVEVTRNFGVQYLWVDALCIIQVAASENKDWQSELPNMGRIYHHSLFTIGASSGEHNETGLFYRAECSSWPVQDYALINETCSSNRRTLKATIPDWNIVVESSALSKRGWVLQERLSASRTLFFTEEGVFWQCNEAKASECETEFTIVSPGLKKGYPSVQEIAAEIKGSIGDIASSGVVAMSGWSGLMERYSEKILTMPTDRLPTISGIAADIARLSGAEIRMGILNVHLIEGLDWCISCPLHERSATRQPNIPTWCWASTGQPIRFDRYDREEKVWRRCATELSLNGRQIRVRTFFQILRTTSGKGPNLSWGQGYRVPSYKYEKYRSQSNVMANCTTSSRTRDQLRSILCRTPYTKKEGISCVFFGRSEDLVTRILPPLSSSCQLRKGKVHTAGEGGSRSGAMIFSKTSRGISYVCEAQTCCHYLLASFTGWVGS
jgi:hypothetical protein